ncbi:MAG TPA: cation-transporting P-type ATPase [Gemmatimonadales bacterium]|nr:cation-transporting P-type ATPase [Gemmatimonadales bacterium]
MNAVRTDWHARAIDDVLHDLHSAPGGLTSGEAWARLAAHGANDITPPAPTSFWRILWHQLSGIITLLLLAAAVIAGLSGDRLDAVAILGVLVINVVLGLATELPARRAMRALLTGEAPRTTVLRDGKPQHRDARELVPGDVIVLEAGQAVPADARLLEGVEARTVEAVLTGESAPVGKDAGPTLAVDTPLADRRNMVYRGTTLADGAARALVVATGPGTEVGRIGALIGAVPETATPLERRLNVLGTRLAIVALAVATLIATLSRLQGRSWSEVLQLGLALGIAAVPEGLPVVATVALAIGMRRMARRRALARRLAVVETLGSTTVICTDKTGTLTTGEMTATTYVADGHEIAVTGVGYAPHGVFHELGAPIDPAERSSLDLALRAGVLASRPDLALVADGGTPPGDPTEIALVVAAAKAGLEAARVRATAGVLAAQIPFTSSRRFMAVYYRRPDGTVIAYMKGAPDRVADRCTLDDASRRELEGTNRRLAARGLRLLALAHGPVAGVHEDALRGLTFAGFVGLADPPAVGVEDALATLHEAGIRTVMLTGDQRWTAEAIARGLALVRAGDETLDGHQVDALDDAALAARVERVAAFSRVTPEAKLRIVGAYQRRGDIVAMLGDGVNDAPALKQADIGVAMGRGADIAKATAGLVLQDDRFETISAAVEEGRVIFDNIRKFVFYLFSCNLGEIFIFLGAGLAGWTAPLLPLQILWLNMITDTFPALSLAFEPAEPGLMRRPPRSPRAAIFSAAMLRATVWYAFLIALSTLAAAWWGLRVNPTAPGYAVTLAFMTLAIAQIFHLGNARSQEPVIHPGRVIANQYALGAVALTLLLQVLAVHWPPLARLLGTVPLGWLDWLVAGTLGLLPAVIGQLSRLPAKRFFSRISNTLH